MVVNRPTGDVECNQALGDVVDLVRAICLHRVCATSTSSRACMPVTSLSDHLPGKQYYHQILE